MVLIDKFQGECVRRAGWCSSARTCWLGRACAATLLLVVLGPARAGQAADCVIFADGFENGGGTTSGQNTTLSGRLLDTNDFVEGTETPIVGATVSLLDSIITTTSNLQGFFTLTNIGTEVAVIDMDTSTAAPGPGGVSYAGFRERIEIQPCTANVVQRPFFLPRIDESSLTQVNPEATTVVTNAGIGVSITVPPHTAMFGDTEFTGQLSISEVPNGLAPAALPEELQPGLLITIQPVGVTFATPVPINLPNTDSLVPDGALNIWSLHPDSGQFVVVGRAKVSSDGALVETVSGGVRAADWHFAIPSAAEFLDPRNLLGILWPFIEQEVRGSSKVGVRDGSLRIEHELPAVQSLSADAAPKFYYDSRAAYPRPVVKKVVRLPRFSFVPLKPDLLSTRLRIDFVQSGDEIFTDTSTLSAAGNEELVQAIQFDASGLTTGVHFLDLTVTSHFQSSTVGAALAGFELINNQGASPFGAGWTLDGLDRLHLQGDNLALLIQGDGEVIPFLRQRDFSFFQNEALTIDCCAVSLVAGDFNGDGYADLVDVGGFEGGVVRLNNQAGGFEVSDKLGLGTDSGHTVVVGLINGDLKPDLAVSRNAFANSTVTVFLGDGLGDFTATGNFAVGSLPVDLALGDFDGNGTTDIVTANEFGGTVSMLLGNGSGSYGAAVDFVARGVATQGPSAIASGDFDEDGKLDVVVTGPSAEMAILFGDGAGGLGVPVSFNLNGSSEAVLVADFNNDNNLDIASPSYTASRGNVVVYLGNGLGGFTAPISTPVGKRPQSLSAGDLNLDGKLDLAVANVDSDTVTILLGQGNGAFLSSKTLNFPDLGIIDNDIVAIADFNLDLYPDLAILDDAFGLVGDVFIIDNLTQDSEELVSPPHVFSSLFENEDGSFRHVLADGITVEFDAQGFQTARADLFGNKITFTYDGLRRVSSVTYPSGQPFSFAYATNNVTITDPVGRQTQLMLNGSGDLAQINSPDGGQTHYAYGEEHNLEMLTTPGGHTYNYQYDVHGMMKQITLPNGEVRHFQPGLAKGLPETAIQGTPADPLPALKDQDVIDSFIDGLGNQTKFTTNGIGAMTTRLDALNRQVVFERDDRQLLTRIRLATLESLKFTYDDRGNMLSSTDALGATTYYRYNSNNLLTGFTSPIGDEISLAYNQLGALIGYDDGLVTLANTFTSQGLLASVSDLQNNTSNYEYDLHGNLRKVIDEGGHVTEFTRDEAGNITSATDDTGNDTLFSYDLMNRIENITNELSETSTFGYDIQGNITTVSGPAGLQFAFEYNEMRDLTSQTDGLGRTTQYGYDVLRNLTSITNPNGTSISYDYDMLNRLTDVTASTGEQASFVYSTLGKMIRMEDDDSLIEAQHDKMGRTTLISYNTGGVHSTQPPDVSYSLAYNDAGQLTDLTQVDGTPLTYTYDARGKMTGITTPDIDHQLGIDSSSRFTSLATQVTGGVASGLVKTFTSNDQLEELQIDINGSTEFLYSITLDDLGNRTGITDNAGVRSYTYDAAGQLLAATHPDQPAESYSYDDLGNRLTSDFTSGTTDYDSANQIVQNSSFEYEFDLDGNLVARTDPGTGQVTLYNHNAFDQLVAVERQDNLGATISLSTYAYDAMGRRISKTVDGVVTKYVHQNDRVVASYDSTDNLISTYLHGPGPNMLLSMETNSEQFVFHADPIGSIIAISDKTGSIVNEYRYDSFGRPVSASELIDNPFGFTGSERDLESGLIYMRTRYYDPFTARFMQADRRGFTSGLNVYHYAKNNPLVFSDPYGTAAWGAVGGAAVNLLGQAAEGRSSAKNTKPLDFSSFAFDTGLGALTCGTGNALKFALRPAAYKTFTILPKNVVLIRKFQPVLSKGRDLAVDLATGFTSASVSGEFKTDVTGEARPSDDDFIRDVVLGTVVGFKAGKFADPYAGPAGNDLVKTIADKSYDYVLQKGAKGPWAFFFDD